MPSRRARRRLSQVISVALCVLMLLEASPVMAAPASRFERPVLPGASDLSSAQADAQLGGLGLQFEPQAQTVSIPVVTQLTEQPGSEARDQVQTSDSNLDS